MNIFDFIKPLFQPKDPNVLTLTITKADVEAERITWDNSYSCPVSYAAARALGLPEPVVTDVFGSWSEGDEVRVLLNSDRNGHIIRTNDSAYDVSPQGSAWIDNWDETQDGQAPFKFKITKVNR